VRAAGAARLRQGRGTGSSTFTDPYSTNMTWRDQVTLRPHRCMWTNELR